MKRSARLKMVEQVAMVHENKAAQALALAQQQLQQEQERLQSLRDYQQDYQHTGQHRGHTGMSMHQFLTIQSFLDQIEVLLVRQQEAIDAAKHQLEYSRGQWLRLHQRRKSIAGLAEKMELQEWLAQEKQEQKQLDDLIVQMQARLNS